MKASAERTWNTGPAAVGDAARPARRNGQSQETGAVAVECLELGAGQPVVFLHGLLGLNRHWTRVAQAIAHRARCFMPQAPLHRLTGRQRTIEGATELIRAAIEPRLEGPAVLVGNSMGGQIALRLALERPSMVRALVLTGSSGLFERTDDLDELSANRDVSHRPNRDWIERKIQELFYDPAQSMPPDAVDLVSRELADRRAARAIVRLSKSAKADYMADRLHRITQPALLIWGRQDIVTPPRVAEDFRRLLPDARLHWLDECGHAPMLERPDAFAALLEAFLDELDGQRRRAEGTRQEVA